MTKRACSGFGVHNVWIVKANLWSKMAQEMNTVVLVLFYRDLLLTVILWMSDH